MDYDFKRIEKKWQNIWRRKKVFRANLNEKKKKFYVLEMYPYPSASFLHMGHVRNYTVGDVYARFKRMKGFNVLYPIGYDSFGLPAEISAKKENIHPKKYTENSIKKISGYLRAIGNSYDWERVIASHEPDYYKWNQYFFLKLYEKGLAYRKKSPVNWCQKCHSVLANEEAEGGKCWRCGEEVATKELMQWFFKITDYADRLLEDLNKIEWPERIKIMQKNWIGKKEWIDIDYQIEGSDKKIVVSTTRPDTNFGATFVVIAPEHPLLSENNLIQNEYAIAINNYIEATKKKTEHERLIEGRKKTGVFTGLYCINQLNGRKMPIWVADFVLTSVGTGAVVGVPGHDKKDFEFAREFNLPVIRVVIGKDCDKSEITKIEQVQEEEGTMVNSEFLNGMNIHDATKKIMDYLEEKKLGHRVIRYKLRDWLISRQRYWGTPIPIIYCDNCGIVPVPEKNLPVKLPIKANFLFNMRNPLCSNNQFVNVKCPKCKGNAKRETDTMGGFVDSSWYFLRYCDPKNKKKYFDSKKVNYWMPVDQYIGGAEHAVMHLMYARFFVKVLKDLGYLGFDEPFTKLFNQGIVYKDGTKMSKSKGNVVFQTDISDKYGIDTARLFLMFVSSPDKQMEWSDQGVEGSFRIINKLIKLSENLKKESTAQEDHKIHSAIEKVTINIENFNYPKAIISILDLIDFCSNGISKKNYEVLLKLISPFCPYVAEELWEKLGNKKLISVSEWPIFDEKKINEQFEKIEQMVEELCKDINNISNLLKIKGNNFSKIYVYALPSEEKEYKDNLTLIKKKTNAEIEIYSVNDPKIFDPEQKAKKAKLGKPALYLK